MLFKKFQILGCTGKRRKKVYKHGKIPLTFVEGFGILTKSSGETRVPLDGHRKFEKRFKKLLDKPMRM